MGRLTIAIVILFFSSAAFAYHCPADAKAIDAGLANANLSDDKKVHLSFPVPCLLLHPMH